MGRPARAFCSRHTHADPSSVRSLRAARTRRLGSLRCTLDREPPTGGEWVTHGGEPASAGEEPLTSVDNDEPGGAGGCDNKRSGNRCKVSMANSGVAASLVRGEETTSRLVRLVLSTVDIESGCEGCAHSVPGCGLGSAATDAGDVRVNESAVLGLLVVGRDCELSGREALPVGE